MQRSRSICLPLLLLSGCVELDGGAVELSWTLREFDGDAVSGCGRARHAGAPAGEPLFAEMRLCWQAAPDGVASAACDESFTFECGPRHGVSGFELPPGPTAFWLEPLCSDGTLAAIVGYQVPPPIVRDVVVGAVVTLNSLLVVVDEAVACER